MKKKLSSTTRNKMISTMLITSSTWIMIIAGAYYVSEYTNIKLPTINKNSKTPVIVAKRVINEGDIINEGDTEEKLISINDITKNAITIKKNTIGKVAVNKLEPNEQIKKYDVILKENKNNTLRPYTIPIKLENLSDVNIKSNDYVDVMVVYPKDNGKNKSTKSSDIVATKLKVDFITDTSGAVIKKIGDVTNNNNQKTPSYINLKASLSEIQSIEDARKKGKLIFLRYEDKNAPKTKVTYGK